MLVQTRSSAAESREFLATADSTPRIAGVVAWADLTSPAVADELAALREGPGGDRLVGIRHQVHDEPDPDWLLRPDVVRGLVAVERAGLVYDLLVRARELPAALEIARAMPGLRLVIDHLAKPPVRDGAMSPWAERLAPFGALPERVVQASRGSSPRPTGRPGRSTTSGPFVDRALGVFGPRSAAVRVGLAGLAARRALPAGGRRGPRADRRPHRR